jgi:hypothetical protein
MSMSETIVLSTDLSPGWDKIIACTGEFKALGCSRVILTNVIVTKALTDSEAKKWSCPLACQPLL